MKKIGILTFHYVSNYGASLQAFALRKFLNSFINVNAEIIPYQHKNCFRGIVQDFSDKKRWEKFDDFLRTYCGLKEHATYITQNLKEYDYYIVGSDQVWNTSFDNVDKTYFLAFVPNNRVKIAYAASIGLSLDDIDFKKELFIKYIPQFDFISLREKTQCKFIESISGIKCEYVVDPTLLMDLSEYEKLCSKYENKKPGKFILFLWIGHDSLNKYAIDFANSIAIKYNLNIVHDFPHLPYNMFVNNQISIYTEGVESFLWHIKHAEIIITNSFHSTLFSTVFHKNFFCFIHKKVKSRVMDYLGLLRLENRLMNDYIPLNNINIDIDYTGVYGNLKIGQGAH